MHDRIHPNKQPQRPINRGPNSTPQRLCLSTDHGTQPSGLCISASGTRASQSQGAKELLKDSLTLYGANLAITSTCNGKVS
mmetsp:Transcript_7848/g.48639  ORF Transcript_7848/g.48639 Transcript_7848/m.48639 type:complete len:81 (-) Transcript_7848:1705-1947(-)